MLFPTFKKTLICATLLSTLCMLSSISSTLHSQPLCRFFSFNGHRPTPTASTIILVRHSHRVHSRMCLAACTAACAISALVVHPAAQASYSLCVLSRMCVLCRMCFSLFSIIGHRATLQHQRSPLRSSSSHAFQPPLLIAASDSSKLIVTRHTPEGEDVDELYTCGIIVGVLVSSLIADVIGTHAIFGAFVYGLAVPNGTVGESVIDKIEDFVNGLLLPLFFVINGLRTDLRMITDGLSALKLVVIVVAAAAAKVGGCVLSAMLYQMPMQDGIELGLLMNTKGIVQLIILNIGKDKRILNNQSFTIMVLMSILLTALVSPLLNTVAKSSRRFVAYKRRTIRWPNPDSELRILTCIHHPRDVPSSITLLDITHPTKRSPIFIYVLHLIELTGRAATLLVNGSVLNDASTTGTGHGKVQTQSEQVVNAFETYEQHAGGVSVQTLTAFSPYQTMHEDICNIAEDKHVALILLPFHKHQTVDGFMEITHPSIRSLNQNALSSAPCSIGILIDRGLSAPRAHHAALHVALIFFGGPDDRESLAFASRMAGHPNISFTLLRFIPSLFNSNDDEQSIITVDDRERRLDEACLEEFKSRWEGREAQYAERESRNAEDTVAGIREIVEGEVHDLYIVGRAYGAENPLMAGLMDWSECPELGAIGDLLSSSDFASGVSVFVVQQGKMADGIGNVMPVSPGRHVKVFVSKPGW